MFSKISLLCSSRETSHTLVIEVISLSLSVAEHCVPCCVLKWPLYRLPTDHQLLRPCPLSGELEGSDLDFPGISLILGLILLLRS